MYKDWLENPLLSKTAWFSPNWDIWLLGGRMMEMAECIPAVHNSFLNFTELLLGRSVIQEARLNHYGSHLLGRKSLKKWLEVGGLPGSPRQLLNILTLISELLLAVKLPVDFMKLLHDQIAAASPELGICFGLGLTWSGMWQGPVITHWLQWLPLCPEVNRTVIGRWLFCLLGRKVHFFCTEHSPKVYSS